MTRRAAQAPAYFSLLTTTGAFLLMLWWMLN